MAKYFCRILIVFLSIFSFSLYAQELPKLVVKYNPTSRFDIMTPSFQMAVEYNVLSKINLQHELGYITKHAAIVGFDEGTNNGFDLNGLRFRTEVRWYMTTGLVKRVFYIAPDFLFKYYIDSSEKTYSRYDGLFMQHIDSELHKYLFGLHAKIGFQFYPGKSRFLIDIYVGSGLRSLRTVEKSAIPEDAVLSWGPTSAFDDMPVSAVGGFKIGYVLK